MCAPKKLITISCKHAHANKWMTRGILISGGRLVKMRKTKDCKPGNPENNMNYREYRNTYNRVIRSAKQLYYGQRFTEYKGNITGIWRTLNDIIVRLNGKTHVM